MRSVSLGAIAVVLTMVTAAFFPYGPALAPEQAFGGCYVPSRPSFNYAFLHPDIVDKKASYAPFFVRWSDYYEDIYFKVDIQKRDNLAEWKERFCNKALDADVEYVVYKASSMDLYDMRSIIGLPYPSRNLPRNLMGNTFAEILVENGCHEAIDYLLYARDCEPHAVHQGDGWTLPSRDTAAMQGLIRKGRMQFDQCTSHFLKMRYAYQMVRLAHYAGRWQQTVDLYRELLPRIDRRKPSIVYFWTLGHQAGALRKLGQYAEAAYRFALIFKHCPSKRVTAFNSFHIRSDADWNEAVRLCQNDSEKATLLILRSGVAQSYTVSNLRTLYALDPAHPQLELLLLSAVHDMERIFLRTAVTDLKYGVNPYRPKERTAAQQLLDLQKFTRDGLQEGKVLNPKLWAGLLGYLELLAGDVYDAEKRFNTMRRSLNPRDAYEKALINQIETWEVVRAILALEAQSPYLDDQAFRIQGYEAYKRDPMLQRFLLDVLSARYAEGGHPGKALVTAFGPRFVGYNPQMDVLDDLIRESAQTDPVFLEKAFKIDTNPDQIRAMLIEMKGVYLFSIGKTEAAVVTMRGIPNTQKEGLPRFKPFKEVTDERIHRPVPDSLLLTRSEIFERILEYDLRARGAEAIQDPVAALYYYLNGLAHYNMSYFGYEWQATDYFRSGANWERLPKGPVFSAYGSPAGNRENTDVSRALHYFEKAYQTAQNRELAARAAFMAARCHQKQWFYSKTCTYRPGSKTIPALPNEYLGYYRLLHKHFSDTEFYGEMIRECKWLKYYH